MKRSTAAVLCTVLMAAALSGCGSSGTSYDAGGNRAVQASSSTAPQSEEIAADTAANAELPSADLPEGNAQKLIWRVSMSLETVEFGQSLQGLTDSVREAGGYIESSSVSGVSLRENGYGSERRASITARIPPDRLDGFLSAVGGVCNVVDSQRSSENVTQEYTDIEMRKKSLEVEEERLLALLEKAEKLESIIELESRLSEVRYQIDSYTSSLHNYDNLIGYSTVELSLREVLAVTEPVPVPVTLGERISSGMSRTLHDIRSGAETLLVLIVVNLPYLAILALVILAILAIVYAAARRSRKRPSNTASGSSKNVNYYQNSRDARQEEKNEGKKTEEK